MAFSLTSEQQAAVDNRGGGLLVSAAAGSGKTRVLVERLLARVEGEGLDIDRFLVITYTKAAAAELRGRIVEELSARLAERPTDAHLRRQATLVYKAQISTVHAFCAQLLRECGHLLELDPDFRLCDEGEAGILMLRALNDVLDRRYEDIAEGSDFARLVDTMSAGRDDSRLMQIVLDIRGRVQAHPNPAAWLDGQERAFALEGVDDPGETPWGRLLLDDAGRQGAYWRDKIARALELCPCDANLDANYAPSLSATLAALDAFVEGTRRGWDAARAALPIPFPAAGRKKIVDCPDAAEQVKAIRSTCKKRMEKLGEWFEDCGADLLEDLRAVHPAVRGLFALVKDFEGAYAAEKARRGMVDFADLEHMAVRLLVGEDGAPTELARQWSARYDEIMVDEYQDTNEIQNAIFRAVSKNGQNIFTVGDVKQSIYRFRLADPTIFLGKYNRFKSWQEAADGEERKILLSRNFRSRREILESTNFIFSNILSVEMGEMDYGEDEALHFGAAYYPERMDCQTEFHLISAHQKAGENDKPVKKVTAEARFVAARIRKLLDEGYPVTESDGTLRPCRPEDIVILMRSPGSRSAAFAAALAERDIPCSFQESGDFFHTMEISVMLSLLEIVDNPRQDVPLISVLRSPLFGFTADRLAEVRSAAPTGDYYDAVTADGGEDCKDFLATLSDLRQAGRDMSVHRLVWHIYNRLNVLGVFGAMDDGAARRENLIALSQHAEKFESNGYRGLFAFVTQLRRLLEQDQAPATRGPAEAAGVRLMSIHKSKGLEFPIVILADLDHAFSRQDFDTPVLVHPDMGLGPKRIDLERKIQYPTLARLAIQEKLRRENLAEEQRILYVAMTRPKEKLILVDALYNATGRLQKLAAVAACPVLPETVAEGRTLGDWVLLPLLCRPEAAPLRAMAETEIDQLYIGEDRSWQVFLHDSEDYRERPARPQATAEETGETALFDPELLSFIYPYQRETALPAKVTATQLKGRPADQEIAEYAAHTPYLRPLSQPNFRRERQGLTPAERGTATHLVLQYLDFSNVDVAGQIEALRQRSLLTDQQAAAVETAPLERFLRSPLAEEIRKSRSVLREYRFTLLMDARDYDPAAAAGEEILLQGVVDCCFETADGLTVVDFKTDRVFSALEVRQRAEHYRPQLEAYSRALERVLEKKVVRRALYFLAAGETMEI